MRTCNRLAMYLGIGLMAGYASVGMADEASDATARWQAYQDAASMHAVKAIPAAAQITDTDELGHRSIALYTADKSNHEIWLVSTHAGCDQPRLVGNRIVSVDAQGRSQACSVDAIHPVDKQLLALQIMRHKAHTSPLSGSAYGPDNTVDVYETNMRSMSMTDGGRTR